MRGMPEPPLLRLPPKPSRPPQRAMNLPDRPCAQATITLVHPKDRRDSPLIEIYFDKPVQGRPGAAHAFRSLMTTRDDGADYGRFRKDFDALWDERFPPGSGAHRCKDE